MTASLPKIPSCSCRSCFRLVGVGCFCLSLQEDSGITNEVLALGKGIENISTGTLLFSSNYKTRSSERGNDRNICSGPRSRCGVAASSHARQFFLSPPLIYSSLSHVGYIAFFVRLIYHAREGQKHEISGLTSVLGFYSIKGKPTELSSVGQKTGFLFPSSHSL